MIIIKTDEASDVVPGLETVLYVTNLAGCVSFTSPAIVYAEKRV